MMKNFYFTLLVYLLLACTNSNPESHTNITKQAESPEMETKQKPRISFKDLAHQSPIDFSADSCKDAKHQLQFNYKASHEVIENMGHTVELFYDKGSSLTFDNKQYNLVQFHFHTPSEHHIDHQAYPMEIHLVHQSEDDNYLVVGILFRESNENAFLASLIPDIPDEEGEIVEKNKTIDLSNLLPEDLSFYTYNGSFTTAPYTENVRWVILREKLEISKEQFAVFTKYEGFNARRPQKLNNRVVEFCR